MSLLNSCSFVKKDNFNYKIPLGVEFLKFTCPSINNQIMICLSVKNCAKTRKKIAHSDI